MFKYIVRWALWFMRKQLIYIPKDLSKSYILWVFDSLLQQRDVEGLMFREHHLYREKENFTHYTYANNILFNFLWRWKNTIFLCQEVHLSLNNPCLGQYMFMWHSSKHFLTDIVHDTQIIHRKSKLRIAKNLTFTNLPRTWR